MKKLFRIGVILALLLCILASCDNGKNDAGNESGGSDNAPHTHEFGEWIITKKAACTQSGEKERSCSCGEKEIKTINATGHNFAKAVEENRVEATCYEEGCYDSVFYCSECSTELERNRYTISKIKHTPAEAI